MEGVYTLKDHRQHVATTGRWTGGAEPGAAVLDVERGVVDGIPGEPWRTGTCTGRWYCRDGFRYKTAQKVVQILAGVVSKNGNLLRNSPLLPGGTLDAGAERVLEGLTAWMAVNAGAIHGALPWKTHAGRPTPPGGGFMAEKSFRRLAEAGFRFTRQGGFVYALCKGWPEAGVRIRAFGALQPRGVMLLGSDEKLSWPHGNGALVIGRPARRRCDYAVTFRVEL